MKQRKRLPKYVTEFHDRHGKSRVRFRRKGQTSYYFKSAPWSPEFMQEYQACMEGRAAPRIEPGADRTVPGSFSVLIVKYYRSAYYLDQRASTRATYRGILERFRREYGDRRVATIQKRHIVAILARKADTPSAANNLLRMLKILMKVAKDCEIRKDDPTADIKSRKITGDGFHTWTEEQIAAFAQVHKIGTRARLAFSLLLYTGQRRSDVVRMGYQHIEGEYVQVRQQKTGTSLKIRMHPELQKVLARTPRDNLTFLTTGFGKPYTPAGFGNWFRDCCNQAGLRQCSAHGLRKAAARRMAEAGCTEEEIKSVTGHKTSREVSRYTKAANQVLLSDNAMAKVTKAEKVSNLPKRLDKTNSK